MHPVIPEQAFFVASVEHKHLMARAERARLVSQYGGATSFLSALSTLAGRLRAGLGGALGTVAAA